MEDAIRRELARGTIELVLLALLASGSRYGYQIISELNNLTESTPEIKEGTLYPVLHRLEDAGHVVSSWEAHDRTPPRKYYQLTTVGRARLSALRAEWDRLTKGIRKVLDLEGAET